MREAAQKLAKESRNLQNEWALQLKARDMRTSDPTVLHEAMLDFVALHIATEKPLFGILIETGQFEKIPETVVTNSRFSEGAQTFKHVIYDATPDYKDIAIRHGDLENLITDAQMQDGYDKERQ